ncbi:unnamed protein product, partial [Ixodes persulcatus]
MAVQYFVAADYCVLVVVLGISSAIGVYFAWKDRRSTNNKEFLIGNRKLQGSQTTRAYSSVSLINVLYSSNLPSGVANLSDRFSCQSLLVALELTEAMWEFQDKLFEMVIPKYLYSETLHDMLFFRAIATPPPLVNLSFRTITYSGGISSSFSMLECNHVSVNTMMSGPWRSIICSRSSVLFTRLLTFTFNILSWLHLGLVAEFSLCGTVETCSLIFVSGALVELSRFKTRCSRLLMRSSVFFCLSFSSFIVPRIVSCPVWRFCTAAYTFAKRSALYTNMAGVSGLLSLASFCGLALFALYHKCDPVKAGIITKYDQLMPHFVMDTLNHLPGLSGLFVTAVYSGSLSTMSSGYNALAAITWEDFLKPRLNLSPTGVMRATKIIAASYGLLAILVAFLSGTIPSILQATFITSGAVGGASGAVFFIGLLLPWCGSKVS